MTSIYKGDDTNAFNNKFLTIDIDGIGNVTISKAEFKCGTILKTFKNPVFPLQIDLNCDETQKLLSINCAYLAVYDELGRKRTCQGNITFACAERVV